MKRFYLGFCLIALLLSSLPGCNDNENGNNDPGIPENTGHLVLDGDISDTIRSRSIYFEDTLRFKTQDTNWSKSYDTTFGGFTVAFGAMEGQRAILTVTDMKSIYRADTGTYKPPTFNRDKAPKHPSYFEIMIITHGGSHINTFHREKAHLGSVKLEVNSDQLIKGHLNDIKLKDWDSDTTCRVSGTFRINR